MKSVTPGFPPAAPDHVLSMSAPPAAANEPAPNGDRLRELFRHELIEFGPAMLMADANGRVTWSNAAFRRIADAKTDNGALGTLLPMAEIAEEIDFRQVTIFRDWDFPSGDSILRLRARFEPLREPDGRVNGVAGLISLLQEGALSGDEARETIERQVDFIRLSSDWMWETDAKLTLTLVTHRVVSALGLVPQQLVGRNLLDFVASEPLRQNLRRRLDKLSPFRDQPFDADDSEGKRRLFMMSAVPVFDRADGSLLGYRGSAADITELTRREESLRNAKEAAESANRAKSQFLANMSHELRTPLNAIIGFADIMRMGLLGPIENNEYRNYVRDMHKSAEHLLGVINDILDVSRIETGQVELQESACNVEELFESAARLIRDRLQIGGLKLSVDLPAKLPRLNADKRKVKQILINLLANAVKFTPQGGRIVMSASLGKQGQMEIVVSDTGIGISPEKIDLVMQPFAQVDSGLDRKFEGVGLGLSLSRGLARLHGGDVRLESELGKGTRAIFTLPTERLIDGNHLTAIK